MRSPICEKRTSEKQQNTALLLCVVFCVWKIQPRCNGLWLIMLRRPIILGDHSPKVSPPNRCLRRAVCACSELYPARSCILVCACPLIVPIVVSRRGKWRSSVYRRARHRWRPSISKLRRCALDGLDGTLTAFHSFLPSASQEGSANSGFVFMFCSWMIALVYLRGSILILPSPVVPAAVYLSGGCIVRSLPMGKNLEPPCQR